MGSSSSGFFRRPRLMNLASSAGVMPLWGMVVFLVLCPSNEQGAAQQCVYHGLPRQSGASDDACGLPLWVLRAQTLRKASGGAALRMQPERAEGC